MSRRMQAGSGRQLNIGVIGCCFPTVELSLAESVSEVLPLIKAKNAAKRLENRVGNPIWIVLKP